MTAEIALLNRRALAFAADSAVTISDGRNDKIYNSAEKIFELSRKSPIGLMLYNNMEFMGIPIDVASRSFRRECDKEFVSVNAACEAFFEFLLDLKRHSKDEMDHLRVVLMEEMIDINRQFEQEFPGKLETLLKSYSEKSLDSVDIVNLHRDFRVEIIVGRSIVYEKRALEGFLIDKNVNDVLSTYGIIVEQVGSRMLSGNWNDQSVKDALYRLTLAIVRTDLFSSYLTGLVFGGFGSKDIFPTLCYCEIDGVYFGQIKRSNISVVDIDRNGPRAEIVPFAQREMVERFLYGIDDELQQQALRFVETTAAKTISEFKRISSVDLPHDVFNGGIYREELDKYLNKLKEKSRQETLSMIDFGDYPLDAGYRMVHKKDNKGCPSPCPSKSSRFASSSPASRTMTLA